MRSLTPLATLLILLLWAPMSMADSGASNSHTEASTNVFESTYGSPTGEESSPVGMIPQTLAASEDFTEILRNLSVLLVLGLGFVGLFWIRKHTAEL